VLADGRFLLRGDHPLPLQCEQAELAETTHAWLLALRERLAEAEEDTEDAFRARRQLVKVLVQAITVGIKNENGGIEVRITYRFGPPSPPPAEAAGGDESFMAGFRNGSRSKTTNRSKSG
jgi:hypothetical protein